MAARYLLLVLSIPILAADGFLGFEFLWGEKILPNVNAATIPLSGLTQKEAQGLLNSSIDNFKISFLEIKAENKVLKIPIADLDVQFDTEKTANEAYMIGHSKNLLSNFLQTMRLIKKPVNLETSVDLNEKKLDGFMTNFSQGIDTPIIDSKLEVKNGQVLFIRGTTGKKIDAEFVKNQVSQNFKNLKLEPITAQIQLVTPEIPEERSQEAVIFARRFVGKKILLTSQNQNFEIGDNEILSLLSAKIDHGQLILVPNVEKVTDFVKKNLDMKVSKSAQNAKFQFDGKRVVVFQPSVDGVQLDIDKTSNAIFDILVNGLDSQAQFSLPLKITLANIKTAEINNFGISELIGRGISNFSGSAPERAYNIKLAASKINGVLVPAGETFSFDKTVGEISTATGYTSAYIISKGRTVLGEGGGVCQVSTTLFRAAVNSGLEITERHAHAYRVRYYEQGASVGLDATIFVPTLDLQFKNDTPNYILIQAYTSGFDLYFDFYGTQDGRTVEVSKPVISNFRPAPEPQYQDDPTLPVGVTKQVDFAASGAYVEVRRLVQKNGQVLHSDVFKSNYQPWQAIFNVGTKQN